MKDKFGYFWMCYKLPVIVAVIICFVLCSFGLSTATQKESVLNVMLIDSHPTTDGQEMAAAYAQTSGIDQSMYEVNIQTEYLFEGALSRTYEMAGRSKFYADIGNEELDVCAMLEKEFCLYAQSGGFLSLSSVLSDEQIEDLGDGVYEQNGEIFGIYIDSLKGNALDGCYEDGSARGVIGVIYNTPRLEEAVRYLKYVIGS